MATILASTLTEVQNSGQHGNLSVAHGKHTLAAAAIADKVLLLKLYAGSKVYGVKLVNAALGASTTVSVGYENADGTAGGSATAFINAQSTASAGATRSSTAPVTLTKDAIISLTVGGAAATGQVDVVVDFEFRGV